MPLVCYMYVGEQISLSIWSASFTPKSTHMPKDKFKLWRASIAHCSTTRVGYRYS